jgi:hypothetical protein
MKNELKNPMVGILVFACVALIALCSEAMTENEDIDTRVIYNVQVKPGSVTYGTHSTASVPPSAMPMQRSSAPMISGGTVRSYAHHGHATMPARSGSVPGKGLYTTSSAEVRTVGSGGGANAGGAVASSGASSSRGISYGGGAVASVAMPVLAVNSSMMAVPVLATEPSMPRAIGPRRARPTDPGTDGEWSDDGAGDGDWYRWDDWEGEWVTPEVGDTRMEGGVTYKWNGTSWDSIGDQGDPTNPQPLGATPWLLMMLLACAYAVYKHYIHISLVKTL